MKWKELKERAEAAGWVFVRHGKKHDIYTHSGRDDVMQIERHWSQEVRKGLQAKLLKQIGGE